MNIFRPRFFFPQGARMLICSLQDCDVCQPPLSNRLSPAVVWTWEPRSGSAIIGCARHVWQEQQKITTGADSYTVTCSVVDLGAPLRQRHYRLRETRLAGAAKNNNWSGFLHGGGSKPFAAPQMAASQGNAPAGGGREHSAEVLCGGAEEISLSSKSPLGEYDVDTIENLKI
ncbi:hypothetical protein NDU88_006741 [Pleurodeles waltl]|uniref:Uncharacterized protein n=1 Tax=Pleurodeles waltl TaxID=8319 RepID=A0AAV7WFJ4_PLEWA|nr:hypothetical protein NDU88_006741 [Pleurodeles waltl]